MAVAPALLGGVALFRSMDDEERRALAAVMDLKPVRAGSTSAAGRRTPSPGSSRRYPVQELVIRRPQIVERHDACRAAGTDRRRNGRTFNEPTTRGPR
jgi:hypothetical protein